MAVPGCPRGGHIWTWVATACRVDPSGPARVPFVPIFPALQLRGPGKCIFPYKYRVLRVGAPWFLVSIGKSSLVVRFDRERSNFHHRPGASYESESGRVRTPGTIHTRIYHRRRRRSDPSLPAYQSAGGRRECARRRRCIHVGTTTAVAHQPSRARPSFPVCTSPAETTQPKGREGESANEEEEARIRTVSERGRVLA